MLFFFFFKQKTAYEMRISDWSSDVCSSDLLPPRPAVPPRPVVPRLRRRRAGFQLARIDRLVPVTPVPAAAAAGGGRVHKGRTARPAVDSAAAGRYGDRRAARARCARALELRRPLQLHHQKLRGGNQKAAARRRASAGRDKAFQHHPARLAAPETSELQSLMRISYAVFCLKKKKKKTTH